VEAAGQRLAQPYDAWIAADPSGGVRLLVTGPWGFERTVTFAVGEAAASAQRVRETVDD
jgi:hypothetical protein